ncbi:protein SRC2-like [Rhododendron vialii]|uniref:protein SRC2-like n=1 Tax=Rhododendron vialii TaxID=182163 RepID=UPI00265FE91E|nr:protein SRC2-like [Rhododendron vialii]
MAYRRLEINVISAKDLKNVNLISKTHAYAIVSISGDPRANQQQRTAVDRSGNASPTWNFPLTFAVEESAAQSNRLGVTFRIRCERTLGDKDIGEVHVPLSELIGPTDDGELLQSDTYQVAYYYFQVSSPCCSLFSGRNCEVRRPSGKRNEGELNFSYKWGPRMASAPAPPPLDYEYPPVQQPQQNNWLAKLLCVELGKLFIGDVISDGFGSELG